MVSGLGYLFGLHWVCVTSKAATSVSAERLTLWTLSLEL